MAEIVEYFSRPEKSGWDLLTPKEEKVLKEEISRCCQQGFAYTARNYFWIVDKNKSDVPFRLWESQELIYSELERLRQKGRPRRMFILKARQLGVSTLVCAMIAYDCMFMPNRTGLVVSYEALHCQELFAKIARIYDLLPWWLKPMIYTRKYDEGLVFDNPDKDLRTVAPGLNSRIVIRPANALGGVGQGYSISDCLLSETADWEEGRAREIIAGDLRWALTDTPDTLAVIETTGKGAGTYIEDLWQAQYELMDLATWKPTFLAWFFEKNRAVTPEPDWKPSEEEIAQRERIKEEWVRCVSCGAFRHTMYLHEEPSACLECGSPVAPYVLSDAQLRWYWQQRINAEKQGEDSLKEFRQEVAATPQDCFQSFGVEVFPQSCFEWVSRTVRETPLAVGNLDGFGRLHAVKDPRTGACYQTDCNVNHDRDRERPLKVWELPVHGAKYAIGIDVGGGVGKDYSVIWVNRIGMADYHVATYRSNSVTPWALADVANLLGRWYNNALIAVEYNIYQTTADRLRHFHQYPNLFRWKHPDAERVLSTRFHWVTRSNTKEWLINAAIGYLMQRAWYIRDPQFAYEMKYFKRDAPGSMRTGAEGGKTDDVVMAAMICLYCSHDMDVRDPATPAVQPVDNTLSQWKPWQMECLKCGRTFPAENPKHVERCPNCRSIMIKGKRVAPPMDVVDLEDMGKFPPPKELVAPDTPWTEW